MKVAWFSIGITVLMLASSLFAAEPVRTLEEDTKLLQGKWALRGRGYEWIINLDPNQSVQIAISWKERGGTWAATGWKWSAKQNEQGRYIELEESTAKASDLPQELHYELIDDHLMLKVPSGPLKGNHTFLPDQGRPSSDSMWIIIGIGALVAFVIVFLVFRSSKYGTPSVPSSAESTN